MTDLGAVAVQQCAAADDVLDVAAGDVPYVGVLGDHAEHRGRASADKDRWVGALDGFGAAERSGEVEVGAIEVERFGLGPQPPDDRARFGEAFHGVGEVVEGQAVCIILAPGQRVAGSRACADTEVEPSAGDDVDGRGDLGQHRRRIVAVYRHQVEACAEAGPTLLANSSTPHAALARWINLFVDFLVTKHGLAAALQSDHAAFETLHAYFLHASSPCAPSCSMLLPLRARSSPTWIPTTVDEARHP